MRYESKTPAETKALAKRLAGRLIGGELLLLSGELGAGKTTFAQGLAEGLGAEMGASSPTFVLERRYPGRLELIHIDLYRMEDAREVGFLVREALSEPDTVVAVEWAEKFPEAFTGYDSITVLFKETGEGREIEIAPAGLASEELLEDFS